MLVKDLKRGIYPKGNWEGKAGLCFQPPGEQCWGKRPEAGYLWDEEQCQRHGNGDMRVNKEQQQRPVGMQRGNHHEPRQGWGER